GFLLEEEGGELVPHHLEDQADVLANELVVRRHLVAQGSERAAARHLVALLQLEVGREPPLEIAPGADLVVDRGSARLDRLEIGLQDFVYQAYLDRKSTRLNSSHVAISYAVFCLKKKKKKRLTTSVHISHT